MSDRISAAEFKASAVGKKPSKYHNEPTVVDGISFDSKAEARYFIRLRERERDGEVSAVELQRPFKILGPKGQLICSYRCDFAFWDHEADRFRVIDVKGVETPVFKLKRKLMRILNGIEIEVVKS